MNIKIVKSITMQRNKSGILIVFSKNRIIASHLRRSHNLVVQSKKSTNAILSMKMNSPKVACESYYSAIVE